MKTAYSLLEKLTVCGNATEKDKLRSLRRTLDAMILDGLIRKTKLKSVVTRKRKSGNWKSYCEVLHYQLKTLQK